MSSIARRKAETFQCWVALLGALCSDYCVAAPSTFSTEVGNAVLCLNKLDAGYFYNYFSSAFGPPRKHEGNAYWFKSDGNLWGIPVTEVLVSDASSTHVFVAAFADATPAKLDEAILGQAGMKFTLASSAPNAIRTATSGAVIAYAKTKAKVYCAVPAQLLPDYSK